MTLDIFSRYFILFIMYSSAGWIIETTYVSWLNKKIMNRGFLLGPYCPIYGIGAILIVVILRGFMFNPVLLFIMALLICGSLEYFTSYIMEKIFKARWWDYTDKMININGRVCLSNLIAFGILGIAVSYFINPYFESLIANINQDKMNELALILSGIFGIDVIISASVIYGFRTITENVNKSETTDNTEQISRLVRKRFSEKSFLHRRFINAYPSIEAIKLKVRQIKSKIEDATNEAKDRVTEKVTNAKNVATERFNDAKAVATEKINGAKATATEKINVAKDAVSEKKEEIKKTINERITKKKE